MKFLTKTTTFASAAIATVIAFAAMSGPASAGCWGSCDTTYYGNYNAGGDASNSGSAFGKHTSTWSSTGKDVYGGADVSQHGVDVYAGSHFTTQGQSYASDYGHWSSHSSTSEWGNVTGGASVNFGKE